MTCLHPGYLYPQQEQTATIRFDFGADTIDLAVDNSFRIAFPEQLTDEAIIAFYNLIEKSNYTPVTNALLVFKKQNRLNDWLYYQLIRKTAQQISPKADNYYRYTLYKWFLLCKSGYDAILRTGGDKMLFYVRSSENIYNIPFHTRDGIQYICLNYHDYGFVDFQKTLFKNIKLPVKEALNEFSYKVTQLPDFNPSDYIEKDIQFTYRHNDYRFKVKLNPQIKNMFVNYPVMDYESYFNIPLSRETYTSLIPILKKEIQNKTVTRGVDFLMRFTRSAFVFEEDSLVFGKEKRFSPEQTLLYDQSDCEDRSALFFYLVKEIYNLPMIVLSFEKHITIAVHFSKRIAKPIVYNGIRYYVCEPTPQKTDLRIGQLLPELKKEVYEVVYEYKPGS